MSASAHEAPDGSIIVRYRSLQLSSEGASQRVARRCIPFRHHTQTVFLIFSPLFAQGCEAFLDRVLPHNLVVLVEFETPLESLQKSPKSALAPYMEHPHLLSVGQYHPEETLARCFEWIAPLRLNKVVTLSFSAGYRLHAARYKALAEFIREHITVYWQNHATALSLGRRWIKNIFSNLSRSSGKLQAFPQNIPVVVLGAGESVERILPFLQDQQRYFFIVAVDSVLPLLAETSIRPDLIVAQDAQLANMRDLIPSIWSDVPLLHDLVTFPALVRSFPRRAALCSAFLPLSVVDRISARGVQMSAPLGSVGVLACSVALRSGSGAVLLAGIDLAYRTGKTHAVMTQAHRSVLTRQRRLHPPLSFALALIQKRLQASTRSGLALDIDMPLRSYAQSLAALDNERLYDTNLDGIAHLRKTIALDDMLFLNPERREKTAIAQSGYRRNDHWDFLDEELARLEAFLSDPAKTSIRSQGPLDYLLIDAPHTAEHRAWALMSAKDFASHLRRLQARRNSSQDTTREPA